VGKTEGFNKEDTLALIICAIKQGYLKFYDSGKKKCGI